MSPHQPTKYPAEVGEPVVTTSLLRGSELVGRIVVDASTGEDLAEIKDVVFTAGRGAVTGFTLRRRGFFGRRLKTVLPIDSVLSIGNDAVMVADVDAISDPSDAPESLASHELNDVIDDEVFTISGTSLGTIRDVVVLAGPSPRVVGFEVDGGAVGNVLIPLGTQAAVSGRALVVPDDFEHRVRSDLTGLAAELTLIETSGT